MTQKVIEQMLFDNFKRHYETNKAPFIINIETSWLETHGEILTEALLKFINDLTVSTSPLAKNDIYFVSISKILEWIQYPTKLDIIASKWLWDCDGVNYDYDEECDLLRKIRETKEELEESKRKNKTSIYDLRGEDLFRNGILTGVLIAFVLALIFTVFYDKYH
jgi:hypothetical protein